MIEITPTVSLDENELRVEFTRASGPGGQNVNKVSSAVKLYFDVRNSLSLEDEVKERLIKLGGNRVSGEGVLVIDARRHRAQEANRLDAIQRLIDLIQKALVKPKIRRKTRPSVTASARRVDEKKRRGLVKRLRRYDAGEWGE